jgi:hypothetical protein
MALSLSDKSGITPEVTPNSFKVYFIQSNWAQQLAAATYLDSVVDIDVQFCFFDFQLTKDLPRN